MAHIYEFDDTGAVVSFTELVDSASVVTAFAGDAQR